VREFRRFAPSIEVRTYYAGKDERPALRQDLLETQASTHDEGWEVLITTYALAQGDDKDRKFFRRIGWNVRLDCVLFLITILRLSSAAFLTKDMF
jgi:SWI/SNF-related matrix-associated actin-dependent regulator 1 of chromatin subfamily A